jgi:hypothetical protein
LQNLSIGRIEEMKIFRLRNLFVASSALALVMLFGCSSSEETSDGGSSDGGGGGSCEDICHGDDVPDFQLDECLMSCGAAD